MKKYLLLMFFAAMFVSCSDDTDIDPDLSKVFVGTWKGDVTVEEGYKYSSDWTITKVNDNTVNISSTYNFVATDPKYTSYTKTIDAGNAPLATTAANSVTMTQIQEVPAGSDTWTVKGVGIVSGNVLTVASTATSKKTGQVTTPPAQRFTKQ